MQERIRGLLTALLCVVLMSLSGCAKEQPLYTAGLLAETETNGVSGDLGADDASGDTDSMNTGENSKEEGSAFDSDTLAGLSATDMPIEASQTEATIGYVYVCGAVSEPGVYPIRADMRVCDAIALAGGFSEEADEEWLNQAATVSDGQKLYVYTVEETDQLKEAGISAEGMDSAGDFTSGVASGSTDQAASAGSSMADGAAILADSAVSGTADLADGKVNLNTATREELMTLPGIGESKADAILAYRSEHGAFASIEEIQNISGIKSGVFSKIKDLITV